MHDEDLHWRQIGSRSPAFDVERETDKISWRTRSVIPLQAAANSTGMGWWARQGLNLWPLPCQGSALPLSYAPIRRRHWHRIRRPIWHGDAFSNPPIALSASLPRDTGPRRRLNREMDLPVAPALPLETTPVMVLRPARQTVPVIFASPHSGRDYPSDFLAAARLDPLSLRRSEDGFVDELFSAAPAAALPCSRPPSHAPSVTPTASRGNSIRRCSPIRCRPGSTPRAHGSAPGWAPSRASSPPARRSTAASCSFAEAERRVRLFWRPFHETLEALIAGTRAMFGGCLLVDCHSMPSHGGAADGGKGGFRAGRRPWHHLRARATSFIEQKLTALGYIVRRNDPYAGGYITRHYGRPREHVTRCRSRSPGDSTWTRRGSSDCRVFRPSSRI